MTTKIKLALTGAVLGVIGIAALLCWLGYQEIVSLHKKNQELTDALKDTTQALSAEVERSNRVENSTVRLEERDNARQVQLRRFEGRLATLAKDNAEFRSVLSIVIPDDLVRGLRSFPKASQE